MRPKRFIHPALLLLLIGGSVYGQNKRDEAVRGDRAKLATDVSWFYDDFDKAAREATKRNRPLMVVFR